MRTRDDMRHAKRDAHTQHIAAEMGHKQKKKKQKNEKSRSNENMWNTCSARPVQTGQTIKIKMYSPIDGNLIEYLFSHDSYD